MNKTLNTILDKLAEQAGEVALNKATLVVTKRNSDDYYNWWQEEVAKVKDLKETVLDLEAKLAGVPAQYKSNEVSG